VLSAISTVGGGAESLFWQAANFLVSLVVLACLFAMFFRWFPDGPVSWHDAWRGGLVTAILFNAGKLAIAWYIGSQGLESTYGAAASVVVLLIWVYYSAQIVLFGGEITHVYAQQHESRPPPA
jgi:membrane protein